MDIVIMTFNLRYDNASDGINSWTNRIGKIVHILEQTQPAVIGTQELLPTMITDFARRLPDYDWFGKPRRSNDEHSAIFFRKDMFRVINSGTFWLSKTPSIEGSSSWNSSLPRICTWGEFHCLDQPNKFRVFNTHLDHMSKEARVNGVRVIKQYMDTLNREDYLPHMLMGDFNAYPNSEEVRFWQEDPQFTSVFSTMDRHETLRKTFHDFEGGYQGEPIDYIFVSKTAQIKSGSIIYSKVDNMYPSDHYPVCARINIPV
ncbi:endonuclease/exonuclease/phosphatase family metal-dependent hydrolase [Bacillus niacini]|uniref:Endonuclease/exonuclease/phosphatase family metal-dependent hydrolase n=1 Tax=Neobacillus niacini TaxID=86668 RepID=A0A852TDR1_9BACI|nr:endonuclease/exonuclease/phosphatase family protein [Neobacillus niacini]NYE05837.1 endonuclease/exonuclease/phosphatase family metal-dependent hydrolase [Neobacillus niacini]